MILLQVPYKVNVNDGVVTISYIPSIPGLYNIEILLEHEPLPGFPKSFNVYPAKANPAHNIKVCEKINLTSLLISMLMR